MKQRAQKHQKWYKKKKSCQNKNTRKNRLENLKVKEEQCAYWGAWSLTSSEKGRLVFVRLIKEKLQDRLNRWRKCIWQNPIPIHKKNLQHAKQERLPQINSTLTTKQLLTSHNGQTLNYPALHWHRQHFLFVFTSTLPCISGSSQRNLAERKKKKKK